MHRLVSVCLASALGLAPFGAWAADLVVWWEKGFYPQEDEAIREIVAVFKQDAGKQVELVLEQQEKLLKNTVPPHRSCASVIRKLP